LRAAQVDVSILAERPKLLPYKDAMRTDGSVRCSTFPTIASR
jgi:2C-methyl-D-erythritol 2,4-cyclodiphosphate synthase